MHIISTRSAFPCPLSPLAALLLPAAPSTRAPRAPLQVRTLLDYEACVSGLEDAKPTEQSGSTAAPAYHALSFGWIAGGMLQRAVARASGGALPTFAAVLEEHLIGPLGLHGQIFAGLPPEGSPEAEKYEVYERLAACTIVRPAGSSGDADLFDELADGADDVALDPRIFNDPSVRRANLPAANMHLTAHALATIYTVLAGGPTAPPLLPAAHCRMVHSEAQQKARSRWPVGFGTYRSSSGACGVGFNGLWNSCGLCLPESRGGLVLAVLVNTYTTDAIAARRVLEHVFGARGYGSVRGHALGGVSFADEGRAQDDD
jgi:hypothetical protein